MNPKALFTLIVSVMRCRKGIFERGGKRDQRTTDAMAERIGIVISDDNFMFGIYFTDGTC